MKSRISSFRIGKELWKKQLWLFALSCLMYFVFCTIVGMVSMNIMSQGQDVTVAYLQADFLGYFDPSATSYGPSPVLSLFVAATIMLGTAAGLNAFSYLHSKTKVDFYHAMPVSRTRLYLIQGGICLVDYLIPAVIFVNLLLLIGSVRGLATGAAWLAGWKMIGAGFSLLVTCYAMASLAMLLTGRLIVGVLGVGVFMLSGPLMATIKESWLSTFMSTYYSPDSLTDQPLWKYSPYAYPWDAVLSMNSAALIISLFSGFVLLGINLMIYRKRPSEAAGRSMAFALPAALIQIVLTVVASMLIGLFFGTIFNTFSKGWFAFGLAFGGLLAYVIIQMIYTPSFRTLNVGLWKLLVSGTVICLITVSSLLGLKSYETRLPARDSIRDVGVICINTNNSSNAEKDLKTMKLPCDGQIYSFLEKLASSHDPSIRDSGSDNDLHFQVRISRKNRRDIYRQYDIKGEGIREEYARLYAYPQFKKTLYPSLMAGSSQLKELEFRLGDINYTIFNEQDISKKAEVFEALKEDVMNLSPEAVSQEIPVGQIDVTVKNDSSGNTAYTPYESEFYDLIPIYPSFSRTLATLEKYQVSLPTFTKDLKEIRVYNTMDMDDYGNYRLLAKYKQKSDMDQVLADVIPLEFDTLWIDTDPEKSVEVVTKDDSMIECRYLIR